jgi:hypothetical protein
MTAGLVGCGGSKSRIEAGAGGSAALGGAQSQGGTTGGGGAVAAGGAAGSAGTGGALGTGGSGAGGSTFLGSGGALGLGGASIPGTGGAGSGGLLKGGATGAGGFVTGGVGGSSSLDGGAPDASSLPKCSEVTSQSDCDARTDCHSVFDDSPLCACVTPGCCAIFRGCANGGTANCTGVTACEMVEPFCQPPYVVSYTSLCYEGCVHQDDCNLLPCPTSAPIDGNPCSKASGTCYYEDCAGAGRMLATCSAGTWKVQSAHCGSFDCQAPGKDGGVLTCTPGQICVVMTSTSFNVTPSCESHTCGTGPMSTNCIHGTAGSCNPKYKVDGTVVSCSMPVP